MYRILKEQLEDNEVDNVANPPVVKRRKKCDIFFDKLNKCNISKSTDY